MNGDGTGLLSIADAAKRVTKTLDARILGVQLSVGLVRGWFPDECVRKIGRQSFFVEAKLSEVAQALRLHDRRFREVKITKPVSTA